MRCVTGDDAQEQFDMIQPVPVNVIIEYRHQKIHDETDEIPQLWPFISIYYLPSGKLTWPFIVDLPIEHGDFP